MTRIQLYMEHVGIDPARFQSRQYFTTEVTHYAANCWDLELKRSYELVEYVGHADRVCYDLDVHAKATKTPMLATSTQKLDKSIEKISAKVEA
jgi:glycyl-tRNA synthetase